MLGGRIEDQRKQIQNVSPQDRFAERPEFCEGETLYVERHTSAVVADELERGLHLHRWGFASDPSERMFGRLRRQLKFPDKFRCQDTIVRAGVNQERAINPPACARPHEDDESGLVVAARDRFPLAVNSHRLSARCGC